VIERDVEDHVQAARVRRVDEVDELRRGEIRVVPPGATHAPSHGSNRGGADGLLNRSTSRKEIQTTRRSSGDGNVRARSKTIRRDNSRRRPAAG
jgi:hypothetical protein